jgi:hypothetical protein
MSGRHFFGYGSLVNSQTHGYDECTPATVRGWKRSWFSSARREVSFLSVVPDPESAIQGLIASVPGGDWAALDVREGAYLRSPVPSDALSCNLEQVPPVQIYSANPDFVDPIESRKPILLSYIDVVVQGYLKVFGTDGVQSFFDTTLGWDTPIRNDRAQPVYSRAQSLTRAETALVDRHLADLPAALVD